MFHRNFKVRLQSMHTHMGRVFFLILCLGLLAGCAGATHLSGLERGRLRVSADLIDQNIIEPYQLSVQWPASIQLDDVKTVTLTIISLGTSSEDDFFPVPDGFSRDNILAEADLEIPRLVISPSGRSSQAFQPGKDLTFTWSVRPYMVGEYAGTLWFQLRVSPEKVAGQTREVLVAAVPIELRVVSLMGLSGESVRWIGWIGILVGFLLGFPPLVRWVDRKWTATKN